MKPILRSLVPLVLVCLTCATGALAAEAPSLADVKTQADLDSLIAATGDPAAKKALQAHAAEILAAAAKKPHVDAVVATLEKVSGSYKKINTTPDDLKQALGTSPVIFDTLETVNLGDAKMGPHGSRATDPFDHAFYEHLAHIPEITSLTILHTSAHNEDLLLVATLPNLKTLSITNQKYFTDEGLAHLAGMKQLEHFSFVGTAMTGKPFKDFQGWKNLKTASFRGSKIDDEGIKELCEHFPNLESLSLAHAHFTDAGAVHLATLTKVKSLELGLQNATPECLRNILGLPIESLQLGEGVGSPAGIVIIKDMKSLRRLTVTNTKGMKDADLMPLTDMTQLEHLELGQLEITPDRLSLLKKFRFLKSMRLAKYGAPYTPEIKTAVQEALPHVALQFE